MPTYIGESKIVDRYLGDRFLEAAYIGNTKVYDPYTKITGTLPMIFKSRAAMALKNYRIYGTENGAGAQTENLFDVSEFINNYVTGYGKDGNGNIVASSGGNSGYSTYTIPVTQNQIYYLIGKTKPTPSSAGGFRLYFLDNNSGWISRTGIISQYNETSVYEFTTPANTSYLQIQTPVTLAVPDMRLMITSTASTSHIPYGYKLPLAVTSGEHSTNYDVYIGDSKLGEYEYADYSEQKVYRKYVFPEPPAGAVMWGGVQRYWFDEEGRVNTVTRYVFPEGVEMRGVLIYRDGYLTEPLTADTENVHTFATTGETATVRAKDIGYGFYIRPFILADGVYNYYEEYHLYGDDSKNVEPTDPPAPLPAVTAYKGENTLSSTETVGSATVKGRIKEHST